MLLLVGILVFVYHVGTGIYLARGEEPLATFDFLYTAAFLCGVVWWLRAEARTSIVKQVYCLGLLVGVGWIVIIPYQLLKTRGARGFIPLVALIGIYLVARVLAVFIYMAASN